MLNTRELIKKYQLRLTKSLGQNFLTDESIVDRIIEGAEITKQDVVIEVGPGVGSMTSKLCEKAGLVVAVEIDKHLLPVLTDVMKGYDNFLLIHGDILKINLMEDVIKPNIAKLPERYNLKVVANLPYYITTPIIMNFLEGDLSIDSMVFMIQKEVGDRMAADPGNKDYGSLTVAVQYYAHPQKLFLVQPSSFIPQPDVDSVVIRLEKYKQPTVILQDQKFFFRVVKAAFGQRRKTLVNALSNSGYFNLSKLEITNLIVEMGLSENIRGEALSISQFAALSNVFFEKNKGK